MAKKYKLIRNISAPFIDVNVGDVRTAQEWINSQAIHTPPPCQSPDQLMIGLEDWFEPVEEKKYTESDMIAVLRLAMRHEEVCGSSHKAEKYLSRFKNGEV